MSSLDSSDNSYVYSCTDGNFTSVKEGGLGVHRAKMHNVELADQVLSVYVTRVYPECKKFKCCICDVVIGSYPNFKRHFDNRHPNIVLSADAICSICNMEFQNAKAVGVHCQKVHNISKKKPNKHIPSSPTPIQSFIYKWKPVNHCPPDIPSQPPSQPPSQTPSQSPSLSPVASSHQPPLPTPYSSPPLIPPQSCSQSCANTNSDSPILVNSASQTISSPSHSHLAAHPPPLSHPPSQSLIYLTPSPIETTVVDDPFIIPPPLHPLSFMSTINNTPIPPFSLSPDVSPSLSPSSPPSPSTSHSSPPSTIAPSPVSSTSLIDPFHECDPPAFLNDPVIPSQSPFIHLSNPSEVDSAFPGQVEPIVVGPPTDNNESVVSPPSPTTEKDPVESIPEFHARWSLFYSGQSSWQEFSDKSDQFAADTVTTCIAHYRSPKNVPAPRRPNRPSARPANNNRQPIGYNPVEARKIQTLYRISKKRAARKIIDDSKPSYSGSVDDANVFFTSIFGSRSCDMDNLKAGLSDFVPSGPTDNSLGAPTTPKEVEKKLKSLSNSAPGADRVEYRHLKSIDPKGSLLSSIFNRCLAENDVPSSWKLAQTILIHKKGDASDISNFHPIALMSCIYKLFASVLANRIVSFSINNDLLSSSQKSARPSEGCYEHTFILQSLVLDANRHDKNIYLAWLDPRNAFGSVPHDVISTTLTHLGVPDSVVTLIGNIYTNASTEVRTPAGNTSSIPILSGVKQGCPLSPILFNLCIELILRSVNAKAHSIGPAKHFGSDISVLAYADDLVIISRNSDKLQKLLDSASEAASIMGLEFRPDKCASLSLTYGRKFKDNIQLSDYIVQGKAIPPLKAHEHYRYVGVPIGMIRVVSSLQKLAEDLCVDLDRIGKSLRTPWQKLDMIRTFVQPCLTFILRAGEPLKASLINYRKKLIEVVRSICNLPLRATSHFVFAPIRVGGLGFQDPTAEVDVQTVVQAIKMLTSSDPFVSAVAIGELRKAVRFAARADPSPALLREFMSGSTRGKFHRDRIR